MLTQRIAYLNRLLRDHLGTTAAGGPKYQWLRSRDRRLFVPTGRLDGISPRVEYEWCPQVPEDRWVLAAWQAPPSPFAWELQFGGQLGYPYGGYYAAASTPCDWLLKLGVEPNERITLYLIGGIKDDLDATAQRFRSAVSRNREYVKQQQDNTIDAALSSQWTNCEPRVQGAPAECFT